MEPLKTNRQVLIWLCICPPKKDTRLNDKWCHAIFSWIIFTLNFCACLLPVLFFIKCISTDLESSLFALFQIFATANVIYMTIILFFYREKITAIFEGLSIIYAASKHIKLYSSIRIIFHLIWTFQVPIVIHSNICNVQMIAVNGCGEFT